MDTHHKSTSVDFNYIPKNKLPSTLPHEISSRSQNPKSSLGYSSTTNQLGFKSDSRLAVNFHHNSSTSLSKYHNKNPSIVSSVLYLRKRSQETISHKIFNYTGGGFKGIIQSKKIKSLLPTNNINPIEQIPPKKKHVYKNIKFPKLESFMRNKTDQHIFRGNILGQRISIETIKD